MLLLVDSNVVRSLVQAHNLVLVLDIAHTLLKKTVEFFHVVGGVLTVNQELHICYLCYVC